MTTLYDNFVFDSGVYDLQTDLVTSTEYGIIPVGSIASVTMDSSVFDESQTVSFGVEIPTLKLSTDEDYNRFTVDSLNYSNINE